VYVDREGADRLKGGITIPELGDQGLYA
jgi:hypothetical protein